MLIEVNHQAQDCRVFRLIDELSQQFEPLHNQRLLNNVGDQLQYNRACAVVLSETNTIKVLFHTLRSR